jgi:hypothetical protein
MPASNAPGSVKRQDEQQSMRALRGTVAIDYYGERLTGCPTCNRWQAATGEWCRLAADDIVALRALKADKVEAMTDRLALARAIAAHQASLH